MIESLSIAVHAYEKKITESILNDSNHYTISVSCVILDGII